MSNEVRVEGVDKVIERLDAMASQANFTEALGKAVAIVERAAKLNAPKGNGELRRSIASRIEGNVGIVYTPLEYAPYVEYGTGLFAEEGGRKDVPWHYQDDEGEWHSTSGQKPHPFMRPALNDNIKLIKQILMGELTNK